MFFGGNMNIERTAIDHELRADITSMSSRSARLLLLLSVLACCLSTGRSSKVLILSPFGTRSHTSYYGPISSVLLDRGHQVTLVSSHAIEEHVNLTQIGVDLSLEKSVRNTFALGDPAVVSHLFSSVIPVACSDALMAEDIQKLDVDDFDLVLAGHFITECFFSLLYEKEVPLILFMVNNIQGTIHDSIGNVDFPSFVPVTNSKSFHPMTFTDRVKNLLYDAASRMWVNHMARYSNLKECKMRGVCPVEMTSYGDIEKKASLLFINNVRALDDPPRSLMPGIINIGCIHCRPAQPLPEDLEGWIQSSGEDGFIYISFGSAVKPTEMPAESRRILVEVFKSLPYRVLWKWNEDTIAGLSPNVKLAKWLPQQDILGHPKLKLFISHGGLFSLLEASYHAAPVLGMPIFLDQFSNVDKIEIGGWGGKAEWNELQFDTFRNTILDLLTDKRYSSKVQRRSRLIRDQIVSSRDEVAYWTEYVIRHKGAQHLHSPVLDMYWYELYNVDVWLFIVSVCVGATILLLLLGTVLLRCCCRCVRGKTSRQNKIKRR